MELTREIIERMQAGPEMDALIAEYVRDWKCLRQYVNSASFSYVPEGINCIYYLGSHLADAPIVSVCTLLRRDIGCQANWDAIRFAPSTMISDAWPILEKMQQMRWVSSIHYGFNHHRELAFTVHLLEHDGEFMTGREEKCVAPTAPLAICRCALLTTLAQQEKTK